MLSINSEAKTCVYACKLAGIQRHWPRTDRAATATVALGAQCTGMSRAHMPGQLPTHPLGLRIEDGCAEVPEEPASWVGKNVRQALGWT